MTLAMGLLLGLAIVLALLLLLLALPVRLRVVAEADPGWAVRAEIGLLGGLVPWFPVSASGPKEPGKPETDGKPARQRRPGRVLGAVPQLILGILRAFRVETLTVDADFGTGDPSDTGRIYGWLTPVIYGLSSPRVAFALRPDFHRACLSGHAEAVLSLVPLRLLPPVARFGWQAFGPGR